MVLLLGVPMILLQWGFQIQDIELWFYRILTEIRIGGITISLVGIFFGILLFMIGLLATRGFQRWLDGSVMSRGQMDAGVRNSIKTGIGYLGVAVAGLIGISAAGIDLSSLALVAGALSLGIGFGLQNIVSNFVSGLILLAERPFKVGDWVVTGTTEGFVKEDLRARHRDRDLLAPIDHRAEFRTDQRTGRQLDASQQPGAGRCADRLELQRGSAKGDPDPRRSCRQL